MKDITSFEACCEAAEYHYRQIRDEDRAPRRFTRRPIANSPATWCVWCLYSAVVFNAPRIGAKPLPLGAFAPEKDEPAKAWVDRCVAIVREWRERAELGARRQGDTACIG